MGSSSNSKLTLALLGPAGMLGSAVYGVLRHDFNLVLVLRGLEHLSVLDKAYGGVADHRAVKFDSGNLYHEYMTGFPGTAVSPAWAALVSEIGPVDGVINCIGVTNRYSQNDPSGAYFTNSFFPHLLSDTNGWYDH